MAERPISKSHSGHESDDGEIVDSRLSYDGGGQKESNNLDALMGSLFGKSGEIISEREERLIAEIHDFSRSDFDKFLGTLRDSRWRHNLSQAVVDAIMEKGFSLIEGDDRVTTQNDPLTCELNNTVQLHGEYQRKTPSDLSLTDKAYKALLKLWSRYPAQAEGFFVFMGQDPQTIRPDVYIEGAVDLMWRPNAPVGFWGDFLSSLHYAYAFDGELYDDVIIRNLDFANKENYFKTATFLEFVDSLLEMLRDYGYSNQSVGQLLHVLGDVLRKNQGSYLLNARTQSILEDFYWEEENDSVKPKNRYPILMAPGVYGRTSNSGIFVSDDVSKTIKLIQAGKSVERKMLSTMLPDMREMIAGGYDVFGLDGDDGHIFNIWKQAVHEADSSLTHRLSLEDIAPSSLLAHKNREEMEGEMLDFQWLLGESARSIVEKEFDFKLSDLALSEQFFFLQFIKHKESREIGPVRDFVKKYHLSGLRTFLSLDYGKDLGDKIVELGNSLDTKAASEIFAKYGSIIDAAQEVGAYVKENFGEKASVDNQAVGKIVENLLSRGKDLLVHFSDELRAAKQKGVMLDSESVLRELSDIRTETMLFLSSFKTLRREGIDLDFRAIKDVEFYSTSGSALSEEDLHRMEDIYAGNYTDVPALKDELLAIFKNSARNNLAEFYVLRYKGKIVGFARFDDEGERKMHFSSFNVDAQFRGSAIGGVVLEKTVDLKAKNHALLADCRAMTDIGAHYIETGFVANRFYDYKGEPCLAIERNDAVPYRSRLLSKGDIVGLSWSGAYDANAMSITSSKDRNLDELGMDHHLNGGGWVLTRYFQYPDNVKDAPWYCVFEKKDKAASSDASEEALERGAA